jgi:hypothetical protein
VGVKRSPKWEKKEVDLGVKKANLGSKKGSVKMGSKRKPMEKKKPKWE